MTSTRRALVLAAVVGALAPAALATPRGEVVPGSSWQTVAPAAVGLDAKELDRIAASAKRAGSSCLVVVRDGKVAGEWYFGGAGPNTTQDVFSVTKSIASTLVGIAQDEGRLRVGESASRWIPGWRGTPAQAVKVRDLLSNDSGREWSAAVDYLELLGARDRTAFAVGLKQSAPPGAVWVYNNSAVQTLERVLAGATGGDVAAFAGTRLFGPLGMAHTTMTRDRSGTPQLFEGVRSTCRDMARLGLLVLDRGRWGSRRVVSASWVDAATGRPSTPLNAAYGYLWWLNRRGVVASDPLRPLTRAQAASPSVRRTQLVPGAPADLVWAIGLGNQIVQVDPATRTVVVRLGPVAARPGAPAFGPAEASEVVTRAVVRR